MQLLMHLFLDFLYMCVCEYVYFFPKRINLLYFSFMVIVGKQKVNKQKIPCFGWNFYLSLLYEVMLLFILCPTVKYNVWIIYVGKGNKRVSLVAQPQRICLPRRRGRIHPWVGKTPGEGNGNPLQESCQGNPRDRGAWQATVHGVTKRHNSHTDTHTHNKDNNHKSGVQRAIFLILNIGPLTNVLNQTRVLWD